MVWLGHQPPTQDLTIFREYLFNKFSLPYTKLQHNYVKKYGSLINDPNEIINFSLSIRSNVMKSLINFSKHLDRHKAITCFTLQTF